MKESRWIMSITQWGVPLPIRPGAYINIKEEAKGVASGERGTVATVMMIPTDFEGDFKEGDIVELSSTGEVRETFGEEVMEFGGAKFVELALSGGANKVVAYVMAEDSPLLTEEDEGVTVTDLNEVNKVLEALEAYNFNAFALPFVMSEEVLVRLAEWQERNGDEKKHFFVVVGGSDEDDRDVEASNDRSKLLETEGVINLVTGGSLGKTHYPSAVYAVYIAGLVVGTPLNESVTYVPVGLSDVSYRMNNREVVDSLEAGSLVLVHDGDRVKIEQGITTNGSKIRKIAVRHAVATGIEKTARESWIGRITNSQAGQDTVIGKILTYLKTFEAMEVLTDIEVKKSEAFESKGDKLFIDVAYTELDSLERIFLTITPQE